MSAWLGGVEVRAGLRSEPPTPVTAMMCDATRLSYARGVGPQDPTRASPLSHEGVTLTFRRHCPAETGSCPDRALAGGALANASSGALRRLFLKPLPARPCSARSEVFQYLLEASVAIGQIRNANTYTKIIEEYLKAGQAGIRIASRFPLPRPDSSEEFLGFLRFARRPKKPKERDFWGFFPPPPCVYFFRSGRLSLHFSTLVCALALSLPLWQLRCLAQVRARIIN